MTLACRDCGAHDETPACLEMIAEFAVTGGHGVAMMFRRSAARMASVDATWRDLRRSIAQIQTDLDPQVFRSAPRRTLCGASKAYLSLKCTTLVSSDLMSVVQHHFCSGV